MTLLISSRDASFFIELALLEMTVTLPRTYPSPGINLSSEGELKNPPCRFPTDRGMPKAGQTDGISKSFMVRSNTSPSRAARAFALLIITLFKLLPIACIRRSYAALDIGFRLAAFSGFSQYCFSYSGRLRPVDFILALTRLAHSLEQKWCNCFRCHASGSDLSVPQSSQEKVTIGMDWFSGARSSIVPNIQYTANLTLAQLQAGATIT